MSNVLKWAAIVLGGLIGVVVITGAVLYARGGARLNKRYDVHAAALAVPNGQAAIGRGKHLVEAITGCVGCHGENLAGGLPLIDDPAIGRVYSSNLTRGQGGSGGRLSDVDYVRAIRNGLRSDSTPLLIMPSEHYVHLSDQDLADIIAYVKSVPPVDNVVPTATLGPMGRVLLAAGALPLIPAEAIDHAAGRQPTPAPDASAEYGAYLAEVGGCKGCHGSALAGGKPANPASPPGPNLTAGGRLAGWSEAGFFRALQTGVTPEGRQLAGEFMPWKEYGRMTDAELRALWLYLKSLPAQPDAE